MAVDERGMAGDGEDGGDFDRGGGVVVVVDNFRTSEHWKSQ